MDELKFHSLNELYERIYPALNAKKAELKRDGIDVSEIFLWNCLKKNKWVQNENLKLYDMVNNIFSLTNDEILTFKENEGY